ncbi:MAG: SDR family NAD-dependent epimerase/dehydratase, partial [Phenylobacterium sp.]
EIVRMPLPQDDPKQRQPDISRAKDLLGWTPGVGLPDGLARTIGYFERLIAEGLVEKAMEPG